MKLSLVIPTYKKEKLVTKQISHLSKFLTAQNLSFELIIVVDGVIDNTKNIVERFVEKNKLKQVKIYSYPNNKGKGYAIRYGMKKAKGKIIGFIDADTDIRMKSLKVALDRMLKGDVDAVLPSKFQKGMVMNTSLKRKVFSYGLQMISKFLVAQPRNVSDVSCGLKLFKKEVIQTILPNLTIDRFAIDSEILYWINRYNFNVGTVPFFLKTHSKSTASNISQIFIILKDLFTLSLKTKAFSIVNYINIILVKGTTVRLLGLK